MVAYLSKNLTRGQTILQVVMWAGGISVTTVGLVYTAVATRISASEDKILNHESRVSSVEAKIERLPVIEGKIDTLLKERGINPDQIK